MVLNHRTYFVWKSFDFDYILGFILWRFLLLFMGFSTFYPLTVWGWDLVIFCMIYSKFRLFSPFHSFPSKPTRAFFICFGFCFFFFFSEVVFLFPCLESDSLRFSQCACHGFFLFLLRIVAKFSFSVLFLAKLFSKTSEAKVFFFFHQLVFHGLFSHSCFWFF